MGLHRLEISSTHSKHSHSQAKRTSWFRTSSLHVRRSTALTSAAKPCPTVATSLLLLCSSKTQSVLGTLSKEPVQKSAACREAKSMPTGITKGQVALAATGGKQVHSQRPRPPLPLSCVWEQVQSQGCTHL